MFGGGAPSGLSCGELPGRITRQSVIGVRSASMRPRSERRCAVALAIASALCASTENARAEDPLPPHEQLEAEREAAAKRLPSGLEELRRDPAISGGVTVSAFALSFAIEAAKPYIAPPRCVWCDRGPDGESTLNSVDRGVRSSLVWKEPKVAARISDVIGLMLAPGASYGVLALVGGEAGAGVAFPVDGLVVTEASALAVAATQVIKVAAGRTRPFAHARDLDEPVPKPLSPDEHLSFPSGHTSLAMSVATASGTVATMRGYPGAPIVWATGLPLALLTGYLRIGADKHYFTDVVAGALLGAAFGVLVPVAFHPPR